MKCQRGERFLKSVSDTGLLEQRLDISLSDIRRLLSVNCIQMLSNFPYNLIGSGIGLVIENRIFEVPKQLWHQNFPQYISAHGMYKNGKIFLKQENWCLKTLYHEALHAVSSFMAPNIYGLVGQHIFLREGITEFLTGYILYKNEPQCYDEWKNKTYDECNISYKPRTKLWCTFCQFIKLEEISNLYFWDGITNWNTRYTHFLDAIHRVGYTGFRDVLTLGGNIEPEVLFTQECIDNFGKDFEKILNSRQSLEYDKIRK